jgi:MoaA/NifB/PqqE/SkfB family radical SAM enzyme
MINLLSLLGRARFGIQYARRMSRGKSAVLAHLAAPVASAVPMPTFVQLRVTNVCNLRCKMCGQWGDTGIFREDKTGQAATNGEAEREHIRELIGQNRQLSLADYVRLLDDLAPHQPVISLFGGEPLLYPHIIALVREVKRRGLTLTIITNGWLLEEHARELVDLGTDTIAVSVDGPRELHDRIRGRDASFERIVRGVRAVAQRREESGRATPVLMAILPVTELNTEAIEEAVAELGTLPLDIINIGLRWFVPKEVGKQYESVMKEEFGVPGTSWRGFEFSWPGGPAAAHSKPLLDLANVMKRLRRGRVANLVGGKPWVSFLPEVSAEDVPAYFTDYKKTFGHNFCPVAWYFAQVEPDGEVCFCGDFPDYFIGNVKTESFERIWRGPRAEAFRKKLAREPLPVCARCCGNYLYGKWSPPGGPR